VIKHKTDFSAATVKCGAYIPAPAGDDGIDDGERESMTHDV
jgi:hypothetical protein